VVPDTAIVDPQTTTTMAEEITACTGIDALVHAMEAYVSNASSALTDLHARAAIPLLVQNLSAAIQAPFDLESRTSMMLGSMLAGLAFSNASLGLVHAMAHSLGGLLDLPHGWCNALLLKSVVDFNYEAASERYDQISHFMGLNLQGMGALERKGRLLERIADLVEEAGIKPEKLELSQGLCSQLAGNALNDPCLVTNPRAASLGEIEEIYGSFFRKS
jgi:alcohol dehydrogenase class IV